jgi:Planctomycete cytochrome C
MRRTLAWFFVCAAAIPLTVTAAGKWDISGIDTSKLPPPADRKDVTFATDIKPLFDASCVRCHGQNRPRGGLRLGSLDDILKGGTDGKAVVPGDSQKSLLLIAAAQIDPQTSMPPKRREGPHGGPPPGGPGAPGTTPNATNGPGPGPGGPPGGPGKFGPPPKPLTAEQVSLVRAWIDQGAK